MQAVAYAGLSNIDDVPRPISETDRQCMAEVAQVLARHGCLERFGLTLLHKHFDVNEGEVMVETCDVSQRILTMKPIKVSDQLALNAVETSWRLDTTGALMTCNEKCVVGSDYKHTDEKNHIQTT